MSAALSPSTDLRALAADRPVHFMGAGGAGMCALAELLSRSGGKVTGCDQKASEALADLARRGIAVNETHDPAHVAGASALVITSAVPQDHPELVAALPDLLRNRFPAIRILACRTLADLAATDAVEKLVWTLEDPTPEVSQAAHAALRSLTRLDLPCDPIAWQSATNSEPRPAKPRGNAM